VVNKSDFCKHSKSFLNDQAYISVPEGNGLLGKETISLAEIPAQPILILKIGGYFIAQIEKTLSETNPQVTVVCNEMNIIQFLIRTTNFLTSISTLSIVYSFDLIFVTSFTKKVL